MKDFCLYAIEILNLCEGKDWADNFIQLKIEFFRRYQKNIILSTYHGISFFNNVLFCLNGGNPDDLGEPKGEYKNNFKKLIESELSNTLVFES